ncbi:LOB DOMAIN-CONTAINING PROTEIN 4-RELATED [Salix viminalis]|uniref:LOB DOMAIN-CONTAINING PROTEIN 4-RELATED n=1 Tax=Salix viminalis TaxID=40686 RepID=A0A9Q0NYQ4_SALVM|nr:LOB DOMAIN-CONTAINING PROTEIN 4-RELATED [Salix viminalis]
MSSISPCASCKFLRRKCTQECVLAPYFPPDQPQKFAIVHKVFGQSNVAKLLNELPAAQRADAVNSLAFEAEERLRDPVYGCVGLISVLKNRVDQLQSDLYIARNELAHYIGPQAVLPTVAQPQHLADPPATVINHNVMPMMGLSGGQMGIRAEAHQRHHAHPQQICKAQQLAAMVAPGEQEVLMAYEQQQQQELARFTGGFELADSTAATGFHQINPAASSISSSFALGNGENTFQIQPQGECHPHQLLLQPQEQQQPRHIHQHPKSEIDEGRIVGPSC